MLSPVVLVSAPADALLNDREPVNGNQELVSDPYRSFVYYGGPGAVTAWNYEASSTVTVPLPGAVGDVRSLDVSLGGDWLVAACGPDIYVLALGSAGPVLSSGPFQSPNGNFRSVCFGADHGIYATYESNNRLDTYDRSTGLIATSQVVIGSDASRSYILETNDAKSILLAGLFGSAGGTAITKYSLAGGSHSPPSLAGVSPGTFGGKLAQLEVTGDRIFMACTDVPGIQVISLDTLALEATYSIPLYPSGVAVSRDNSIIYGVSANGDYATGRSAIYAFEVSSGTKLSTRYVDYVAGPIAATSKAWVVATASPLRLETVGPEIKPNAPLPGSVFAYSPGFVRFNITHDPVIEAGVVTATVDGTPYPVVRMTSEVYQINLTSALAAGSHSISVSVPWGGTSASAAWTFTSGSTDATALRPALSLIEPAAGSNISVGPSRIVVGVDMPAPPPFDTNITVTLSNLTLSAVADPGDPTRYTAILPSGIDLNGESAVTARANVDGFIVTGAWNFTVGEVTGPRESYDMIGYGENFSIPSPVNWTVQRDFGGWELAITGPPYNGIATNLFVDIAHDTSVKANWAYIDTYAQTVLSDTVDRGDPAEMVGEVNHTAISNLTAGVWKIRLTDQGVQEAYALIVDEVNGDRWLIKCSASDTSFIDIWPIFEHMISGVEIEASGITPVVVPPSTQGYAYYRMLGDYQLMVPDNWTIKREVVSGDVTVSMKLTGPKVGEFHVTMLLQNGTDPSLRDDQAYLVSLVQSKFLPELKAKGIEATVYEEARILSISNHTALVFSIRWTDLQNNMSVVQEVYYIVDGESHRYWMFTCESPEEAYPNYVQIFDKVAQSFTPLGRSSDAASSGGLLSDPATVLMIAVLVVTGAAAAMVFLVARRYRSRP